MQAAHWQLFHTPGPTRQTSYRATKALASCVALHLACLCLPAHRQVCNVELLASDTGSAAGKERSKSIFSQRR